MPELANPLSLLAVILNEQRSSKSPTVPFQIRNVLPGIGLSGLVWPTIAPSRTDQSSVFPSQPERSLPLQMALNPGSTPESAATEGLVLKTRAAPARSKAANDRSGDGLVAD